MRKLGEGAVAEVYEGVQRQLGLKVALKVLHRDSLSRGNSRRRFINEASAIARLSHPNLISILDVGETSEGVPFMALEFLPGSDLREVLRKQRRLSVARAARLVQQACWGMACAHRAGLVHRDLKPENLFIVQPQDGPEICKVIDFGLARSEEHVALTREGALVGTVRYMAPEQARVQRVDQRADVYALGVILYEALCGEPPYFSDSNEVTLFRIMNDAPCEPRRHSPEIPPELSELIERTLAKNPAARPASATELAEALQRFVGAPPSNDEAPCLDGDDSLRRAATLPEAEESFVKMEASAALRDEDAPLSDSGRRRRPWKWVMAGGLAAAVAAMLVRLAGGGGEAVPTTVTRAEPTEPDPRSMNSPTSEQALPPSTSAAPAVPTATSAPASSSPTDRPSELLQPHSSKAAQRASATAVQAQLPTPVSRRPAIVQPGSVSSAAEPLRRVHRDGYIVENPYQTSEGQLR